MPGRVKTRSPKVEEAEEQNEYELEIARKRAELKATVAAMRVDIKASVSDLIPAKKAGTTRKRKITTPTEPTRRSGRVTKKPELFALEEFEDDEDIDSSDYDSEDYTDSDGEHVHRSGTNKRLKGERGKEISERMKAAHKAKYGSNYKSKKKCDGKIWGPIPGIPVGKWWKKRDECGKTGVHPPTVAGIFGGSEDGAFSVAVSAGYPEDIDNGESFTYTGSGGRELKTKNLRTAPQSSNQELTRGNLALYNSSKTGKPIRVIRGFKAKLGPVTGYRYDGLYKVMRAYESLNADGKFTVWKYDFERLPDQPPVDYNQKERELKEIAEKEEAKRLAEKEIEAKKEEADDE